MHTNLTQSLVAILAAQAVREYTRGKANQPKPKPEPAPHDKSRKVA